MRFVSDMRRSAKMFIFNQEGINEKISYERRDYESVDVRSLFWVVSHRSAESSTPGLKGL